jgi:hypothetical protein
MKTFLAIMKKFLAINEVICNYYKLYFNEVIYGRHIPDNIKALHLIYYFGQQYGISQSWLTNLTHRKEHSIVVHAKKSVRNQIETNKAYRFEFQQLEQQIQQRLIPERTVKSFFHYFVMSISV